MPDQSQDPTRDAEAQAAASEPVGAGQRVARAAEAPVARRLSSVARAGGPRGWQLGATGLLGALAAAGIGYLTSQNASAEPSALAVSTRVVAISALILTGIWAQTSGSQQRMGRLLVAAGFLSCLWFLQGSRAPLLFTVGAICSGFAAVLFAYLMLAHPTGSLRSRAERRFIGVAGGVGLGCWILVVLTSPQLPFRTPLIRCAPDCPSNPLFLGFRTGAVPALKVMIALSWLVLAGGVVLLLVRRMRSASPPARHMIAPVLLVAAFYLLAVGGFLVSKSTTPHLLTLFGVAAVSVAILIPLASGLGLITERLFMGQALQGFVSELAVSVPLDLEARMSASLHDPLLRIAFRRPILGTYVDVEGAPVAIPAADDSSRAMTAIKRGDHPVAVIIHDAEMSDQGRYVEAAGTAAMIWLENAQLQADLRASVTELADSRSRLIETADHERQRIERDLHDGMQQHLVGTQLRLQTATETIRTDPEEAERMLAAISDQVDDALEELRSLARGIYPPLLEEHGLRDALRSVGRRYPRPVVVRARGVGRYRAEVEASVYFCCLEALQNAAKHAGPTAVTTVRLWERSRRLCFEVSDTGLGFTAASAEGGIGLASMHDRLDAVSGSLTVTSSPGRGTTVRGAAPV